MAVLSVPNFIIATGITTNSIFISQLHCGIHNFPTYSCCVSWHSLFLPLFSITHLSFDVPHKAC